VSSLVELGGLVLVCAYDFAAAAAMINIINEPVSQVSLRATVIAPPSLQKRV
jgi:hypothetical protein